MAKVEKGYTIDYFLNILFPRLTAGGGYKEIKIGNVTFGEDKLGRYYDLPPDQWDKDAMATSLHILLQATVLAKEEG